MQTLLGPKSIECFISSSIKDSIFARTEAPQSPRMHMQVQTNHLSMISNQMQPNSCMLNNELLNYIEVCLSCKARCKQTSWS